MKKFLYAFLALILVLFIIIYSLLFTGFGNNIIANIAQNKVKQDYGLDLNITRFTLRPSSLDLEAVLNDTIKLEAGGILNLFKLAFELDYKLGLNKNYVQKLGLNLKKNIHFAGKIKGNINDFIANGNGILFGSNVTLDSRIYDLKPIDLKLDAQKIKLEEILNFLNQAPYFKGEINLISKISAKDLKPDGNAIIKLDIRDINYAKIEKDFGLKLPLNSDLNAEILALIKNNQILSTSKIQNSYLSLSSQKTLYDMTQNEIKSDFKLKIPLLSKMESLTKTQLNGSLDLVGDLIFSQNTLQNLNAEINGLGGEAKANIQNEKVKIQLNGVKLEKILALAGYGSLANGNLNARLMSEGLDFKNFNTEATINNAMINPKEIKKITHLDFPNANFTLKMQAKSNNGKINYNGVLASTLLNIKQLSGSYDLNNAELKLDTQAFIENLSQFSTLAGQKLQGSVDLKSKAHIIGSKIQNLDIDANLAGGKIIANSKDEKLDLKIENLDLQKAFLIVGLPRYASGNLNGEVKFSNLDLKKLNGNVNLDAKGVLNASVLSQILGKKFPANTNYNLKTKALLKDSVADFDGSLYSSLGNLKNIKGNFDPNRFILNSNFTLALNDFSKLGFLIDRKLSGKADFEGKISFNEKANFFITSDNLFEGKLKATLENDILKASLDGVNLSSLAKGINIIDLYEGKAKADINYNLLTQNGTAELDMNEGRLKKNAITNAIKLLTFKDITDDVFHSAKAEAKIRKELVDFSLNMQANNAHIIINKAKLNTNNQLLNVPFDAKLDRVNFKGVIEGTSENPKVKLNADSIKNTLQNIFGKEGKNPEEKAGKKLDKLFKKIF